MMKMLCFMNVLSSVFSPKLLYKEVPLLSDEFSDNRGIGLYGEVSLSFLAEIGETKAQGRLVFTLVADAGYDKYQNGKYVGKHLQEGFGCHGNRNPVDVCDMAGAAEQEAEDSGTDDGHMRTPECEDDQCNGEPTEGFKAQISFLRSHVVDDVIESAKACDAAADTGCGILVLGYVDADSVCGAGVFTDGSEVQTDFGAVQNIGRNDCDDYCQEEKYAEALKGVGSISKGEAVKLLGTYQINGRINLAHDNLHKAHTEGGQSKTGNILVGAQSDGEEAVNQAHKHCEECGTHDAKDDNHEAGQGRLCDKIQHKASARAAHTHDSGNAEVQMAGFFGEDFTGGTVHEGCAEGERVNEKAEPDIHLTIPPLPETEFFLRKMMR